MTTENYAKTEYLIDRWWLSLIVGIASTALGFIILVQPAASYYTLAVWMGIVILLSGIMGLMQSLTSHNYFVRRGWLILASIADIIIGLILLFNTLVAEYMMPIILGCWLLYRASAMMSSGLQLRRYGNRDAGWMIFYAIVMLILSVAILWMPTTLGANMVILLVSVGLIVYGVGMFSLAMRLWEIHRHARTIGANE